MLHLILGTMKSGKSTLLLKSLIQADKQNRKCLFIRNSIDTREFLARDFNLPNRFEKYITNEKALKNEYKNYLLLVDEVQFLEEEMIDKIITLSLENEVICSGLSNKADKHIMWESVTKLFPYAEKITKLSAYCDECSNENAVLHFHLGGEKIGDNYKVLCRKCAKRREIENGK